MNVRTRSIAIDPKWLDKLRQGVSIPSSDLKKSKPCRIKLDGKFVVLSNGKTIWKKRGDAKSAFKNNFSNRNGVVYDVEATLAPKGSYEARNKAWRDFIAELESQGILEFVEVDE